jgi:glyoxylase-like metal-dependent hydrolase (beta-lactamase superfamily II)
MTAVELEPIINHAFLVHGENHGRFPQSHSILIVDDESVLIDTGCGIDTLKRLKTQHHISVVINSHTHPDHSAGNWVFRGTPIFVPKEGFATSGDIPALAKRLTNAQLAPYWQRFVRDNLGFRDCPPTDSYTEGHTFRFGELALEPIATPGHTKDHYCFYERKRGVLFSFDYDMTSFPWYGHRESSLPAFRASIRKLKALGPRIVVSAHRGILTQHIDAEFDAFDRRIDERSEKILALLTTGQTIPRLVEQAPIYGRFPYAEPLLRYWEGQMIEKHLKELADSGRVSRRGRLWIPSTRLPRSPSLLDLRPPNR